MGGFSVWALSIAGVCVLSVLVELVLPEGQTRKYIKTIFSFFIIVVIIAPLPKLVKKEFDINDIFAGDGVELQEDFIYQMNRNRLDQMSEDIVELIEEKGVYGVKVLISANIFTNNMEIDAIFVDLFEMVIREDVEHINTSEIIVEAIEKVIDIDKEKIIFNE